MKSKALFKTLCAVLIGASLLGTAWSGASAQSAPARKYKIFLSLSYSGNNWMSETSNMIQALAKTPPYDKMVDLKVVISGTDPQAQIAAYESMIDAKADGIISFPISPTALNRTVKRGCEKGVKFFMYDSTVTEPCAYNVSYISAGFGENTAQALVNELGGHGKIFMNRGVPGTSVDKRHADGARHVFAQYPGIQVVSEYYGYWDDRVSQKETAKALAAHPDVDGIWSELGEAGVLRAVADRKGRMVPITGENMNGFRLGFLNKDYVQRGFKGVSSGSPPATAGYAFKLMMEVLTGKRDLKPTNIEYPLPWAAADQIKLCNGKTIADGCNVFAAGLVPDGFSTEIYNPTTLPEVSLDAVLTGKPTPGATIQPLPAAIKQAADEPGINCSSCKAAPDEYRLTVVKVSAKP
ncbi:sugar ABC transporter substrate-binding protein [Paraburkholderia silvatlantica]|uniref:Monosaccharide ABC transporter substrate-binding protein (CUT2 family) n=1 Tax=Paraburkholderia silvatlantica TaxID=321895 RepID=A0A2U1A6P4_9BURK|nr:sugar ABC transporter substrate-binding protein [Paraburkholderia silvatlantica]MBB2927877.1 ribose transport system substrate-binding protein [Paraburkholderia silvatlantica]PVY27558.1 monosaccharide ABC transporter substrate-binding protein (CUT2 family) [Paraburkholderia silvatlantica]PXW34531.1 monosaccharide ABC transporter substrate-binding protein (CUT2 family) [Paraburkholderia silvatlantica]PYE17284.1 monosaccharide ABC transporter substrate-binding protein (CUT2 family) [Paraburkho